MPLSPLSAPISQSSVVLVDRVYEALLDAIVTGELAPGEPVREVEIADVLGVSRTPVREAFRRLATSGLVVIEINRGSHVAPIEPKRLLETGRVIAELCGLAAKLATARLTDEDEQFFVEMELDLFTRVVGGRPGEQTSQAQDAINRLLERSESPVIREAIVARRPHLLRLFRLYGQKIPLLPMAERTAAIASAVRARDAELLGATIRSYYEHIATDLVALAAADLGDKTGEPSPAPTDLRQGDASHATSPSGDSSGPH